MDSPFCVSVLMLVIAFVIEMAAGVVLASSRMHPQIEKTAMETATHDSAIINSNTFQPCLTPPPAHKSLPVAFRMPKSFHPNSHSGQKGRVSIGIC
jgi:hypothetical protein